MHMRLLNEKELNFKCYFLLSMLKLSKSNKILPFKTFHDFWNACLKYEIRKMVI